MIAKINTPLNLGSPTLAATTASLRNRLPTQMRRCIPLYVGCVVLVLFIFNMSLFRSSQHHTMLQPPLAAGKQAVPATGAAAVVPIGNAPATAVPAGTVRENFPRKIWQSWKVNPLQFERKHADVARSWAEKNPEYRYEVLTDGNQMQYVEEHFGPLGFNRPDIVNFFRDLKDAIVKADLLRYLIMYAEGGLWADIDVEAMKPMQKFIPPRYDVKDIDMVVGVEIDEPDWKDHPILGPKSRSFCQWTFMCKPQQPVMMRLIEHIMTWLTEVAANQTATISDVHLDFDQIISGTGPSAFTEAIMTEMNILAEKNGETKKIEWDDFHDISESKVVSRVLVLTVEAFAAGQGHSESGTHDSKTALVRHHYHASNWPGAHPRYNHPAYGEVEKCNWKDDCVRKWDEDVAAFNKMTPEEQAVVVGEKERERQEQKEKEEREKKEREEEDRRREQEKKDELHMSGGNTFYITHEITMGDVDR
ncbi:nucleotide-diphospho-sugar transferase [Coniochaeta sp. 2T2.1]|nr:nucleotide-diphospho-sugar transferase [Coniochaeta sp. 2T2.1]